MFLTVNILLLCSVLKEDSVLAALIAYVQRIHEVNDESRARMLLAFQVLAGPFERPLPPLNWTVLLPVAQQYVSLSRLQVLELES